MDGEGGMEILSVGNVGRHGKREKKCEITSNFRGDYFVIQLYGIQSVGDRQAVMQWAEEKPVPYKIRTLQGPHFGCFHNVKGNRVKFTPCWTLLGA